MMIYNKAPEVIKKRVDLAKSKIGAAPVAENQPPSTQETTRESQIDDNKKE